MAPTDGTARDHDPSAEPPPEHLGPAAQRAIRRRIHWLCAQVEGSDVLDVGCGDGGTALLLGREGSTVVGVDHAQSALDEAERRLAAEADAVRGRVRFLHAEANDLPLPDASFDTVLLGEVLEHLVRPRPVLDEAARLLRPGGALVLTIGYERDAPSRSPSGRARAARATASPSSGSNPSRACSASSRSPARRVPPRSASRSWTPRSRPPNARRRSDGAPGWLNGPATVPTQACSPS